MNNSDILTTEEVVQSTNNDIRKRKVVQKYQRSWEKKEEFQHWLKPVIKDCYKAFCVVCKAMLKSNLSTLRTHGQGKRHLHAMSTYLCEMSNSMQDSQCDDYILINSRNHGVKRYFDEDSMDYPEAKLKKIVIDCSDGTEKTQETVLLETDEQSSKVSGNPFTKHRPQKYREAWETNSDYSPWLRPLLGDSYRAYCLACQVAIKSELVCIKGHAKGLKHQKSMESFKGEEETLLSHPHLREFLSLTSVIQDKVQLSSLYAKNKKYKSPAEELKNILLTSSVLSCRYSRNGEVLMDADSSEEEDRIISKVIEVASHNFSIDLHSFLSRNLSVIHSLRDNEEFVSKDAGFCRLTRMLVGYLAQDYMMDYAMDSWRNSNRASSTSLNCRLNSIEETMDNSVDQLKVIRAEFQKQESLDRTLTNFSIEKLPIDSDSLRKDIKIEYMDNDVLEENF